MTEGRCSGDSPRCKRVEWMRRGFMIIDMEKVIIVHYSEIALKGKNRIFFEEVLRKNLERKLEGFGVKRLHGKMLVELAGSPFPDEGRVFKKISETPGVAYFAPAVRVESDFGKIKEAALVLAEGMNGSFRIKARRSDKKFPMDSREINEKVGEAVLGRFNLKVNLKDPDNTIFIEVSSEASYLYKRKLEGIGGGLPVGSGGRAMALLSAGFDSPVAAYLMMKRGVEVSFIHFHSYPYVSRSSIDQARRLAERLGEIQGGLEFISFPFAEIQKKIIAKAPEKLRVILYRRTMLRIAEKLAGKIKAEALVTGDSLGQVASQTLRNMGVIEEAAGIPVLRPLVGMNKEEIISLARRIGTYDISSEPYDDCCSFMMPEKVETRAELGEVKKAEEIIGNVEKMIDEAMKA